MKNKTLAAWLSFLGGPVGLHRFYMFGKGDWLAWVLPWPTLLGLYGFQRAQDFGVDDPLSWWLVPLLGITIAVGALNAIYWGLMSTERWNSTYNPQDEVESPAGTTNWLTVVALILSLMVGTTALLSTLAYGVTFSGHTACKGSNTKARCVHRGWGKLKYSLCMCASP